MSTPKRNADEFLRYYEMAEAAYNNGHHAALETILDAWDDHAISSLKGWMYSDVAHMTHTYRGLIALKNKDPEAAKRELLKSAKVSRGGAISVFGPNMRLAHKLLEYGDREIVLRFLRSCRNFWLLPTRVLKLRKWQRLIKAGHIPAFAGHV